METTVDHKGVDFLPPVLRRAYSVLGVLKGAGMVVSGLATFGMMAFIVADVVSRNVWGSSIPGAYEIIQNYFMIVAVFPAIGYVMAAGILPRLDLAVQRLRGRIFGAGLQIGLLGEAIVLGLLVYYSFLYALSGFERGLGFSAAGSIYPLWPVLFLIPAGLLLALAEVLFVLIRNFYSPIGFSMEVVRDVSEF